MSRVEILRAEDAPLLARPYFAGGDPGPIAATLAHVPELLEATLPFVGAALGPSAVDFRTKEIVIVRTSADLGCRYCVDTHSPIAIEAGLSRDQVLALREPPCATTPSEATLSAFPDDRDRALIRYTDAIARGSGAVDDDVADTATSTFSDAEVVELTVLIGATMLLNRYATALGLPVSADTVARLGSEQLPRA